MKTQNKKGFTIVELVIVIAVIAILAAVLIPTFINLTKKANESNLTVMVTNLNKSLRTYEALNGEQKTMHGAVLAAQDAGYDLVKLASEQSEPWIVYDPENREFVKEADVTRGEEAKYFRIYKEMPATQTFSIYLAPQNSLGEIKDLTVGFDAGLNATSVVNYTDTKEANVTIRMNGGELTVDDSHATVNFYGQCLNANIKAVDTNCFNVYGKIFGNLTLTTGKVSFEATADVRTFIAAGNITINYVSGAQIGTAIANDTKYESIISSSQLPAECKSDVVLTENQKKQNALFAGGLGTEKSPYLIATAEQFNNINKLTMTKSGYFFEQTADISITAPVEQIAGGYNGGNYKINCPETISCIFYKMVGHLSVKNVEVVMGKNAVTLLWLSDWETSYGASFENLAFSSTARLATTNESNFGFVTQNAIYTMGEGSPVYNFKNITNNVNLQNDGTCTGFIIGSGPCPNTKTVFNFENCINKAQITGLQSVGFLYGNSTYITNVEATGSVITVNGCRNEGILLGTADVCTVAFAPKNETLNKTYQNAVGGQFINTNCMKDMDVTVNQNGNKFSIKDASEQYQYKLAFSVQAKYMKKDGNAWTEADTDIAADENKWHTVWDVSNGLKYFIDLPTNHNATGNLTSSFKAYDKKTAQGYDIEPNSFSDDGYAIVVKDNVTYLVFDTDESVYINCAVQVIVYAQNSDGMTLGTKTIIK